MGASGKLALGGEPRQRYEVAEHHFNRRTGRLCPAPEFQPEPTGFGRGTALESEGF